MLDGPIAQGKFYVLRNGKIIGPIKRIGFNNRELMWQFTDQCGITYWWWRYGNNAQKCESPYDISHEYHGEFTETKMKKVEAYKSTNGQVYEDRRDACAHDIVEMIQSIGIKPHIFGFETAHVVIARFENIRQILARYGHVFQAPKHETDQCDAPAKSIVDGEQGKQATKDAMADLVRIRQALHVLALPSHSHSALGETVDDDIKRDARGYIIGSADTMIHEIERLRKQLEPEIWQ